MTTITGEQVEALKNLIRVGRRLAVLADNLSNMGQNGVTDPRLRDPRRAKQGMAGSLGGI
jgi:hypothetical protein